MLLHTRTGPRCKGRERIWPCGVICGSKHRGIREKAVDSCKHRQSASSDFYNVFWKLIVKDPGSGSVVWEQHRVKKPGT